MNFSCLYFDDSGEVCFAEVLTVPSLSDALALAQDHMHLTPSCAWFELWLDGERVASSQDSDPKPPTPSKSRGLLH